MNNNEQIVNFEEEEKTEVELLKEKIQKLEGFLSQVFSGPRGVGTVVAGPINGFYRVKSDAGGDSLIPILENEDPEFILPKIGSSVITCNGAIESVLPDELHVQEPPTEFTHIDWNEIGGMKSQIEEVRNAVEKPLLYAHIYEQFNRPPIKGMLLSGPPGVGKTMIAKAIASHVLKGVRPEDLKPESFIYLKGGEMLSKYVGEAEGRIKELFESTRKYFAETGFRSVVFIDEAEAILPKRGSRQSSDVDKTIVPTFLAEMDGFGENNPFLILATNFPHQLDDAVIRPGRIDIKIALKRPDKSDSIDIFKVHLNRTRVIEDKEKLATKIVELLWNEIKDIDDKISGAYIANLVNISIDKAIERCIKDEKNAIGAVTYEDLVQAMMYLKSGK